MAKAPMCKVCGHAHWGHEPHVWDDKPAKAAPTPKEPQVDPARLVDELKRGSDLPGAPEKTGPKRDRAAYMRAYRAAHPKGKD